MARGDGDRSCVLVVGGVRDGHGGPHARPSQLRMPRLYVVLVLMVLTVPHSTARKKKTAAGSPSQKQHSTTPALAGISSESPAAMRSTSTSTSTPRAGEAFVRHLFSTPLYVANVSDTIDVEALSALALDGYSIIEDNPTVQQELRELKLSMHGATSAQIRQNVNDDAMFTHNDKFFLWQLGNEAKCEHRPAKECANIRWDGFWKSEALRQMRRCVKRLVAR